MGKRTHALSQKTDSCVSNLVPSMLGSPHWDFHVMLPGARGSSEDTSSASQIGFWAVPGQEHLPALLLNERADVRPLIREGCGSPPFLLTAPGCCSQTTGERSQVTLQLCILPGSWKVLQRDTLTLGDPLPADDCQRTTHSSSRNYTPLTAHPTGSNKQKGFHTNGCHNHGNMHINQSLELFSFLPATRVHPTQL